MGFLKGSYFLISISGIYIIIYYLKLRFKQILQQLKQIRNKNLNYLMKLTSIHNKVRIDTKNVNTFYSLIKFEMYYIGTAGVNLLLILAIYGGSHTYIRTFIILMALLCFTFLFFLTYTIAQLSNEVHGSYNIINSILAKFKLPLIIEMKVILFLLENFSFL